MTTLQSVAHVGAGYQLFGPNYQAEQRDNAPPYWLEQETTRAGSREPDQSAGVPGQANVASEMRPLVAAPHLPA
jgi:hypothetical protein